MATKPASLANKFVRFFDKTSVKVAYVILLVPLIILMVYVALDTGNWFDYAIVVLASYFVITDAVELARRFLTRQKDRQL